MIRPRIRQSLIVQALGPCGRGGVRAPEGAIAGRVVASHALAITRIIRACLPLLVAMASAAAAGAQPARPTALEMVLIRPGSFIMGSPGGQSQGRVDETQHRVLITRPFLLGKTEITHAQWLVVTGADPGYFSDCGDCPMESVSWLEAIDFCNALSRLQGLRPAYEHRGGDVVWRDESDGFRLPTEAEWEYACRAGTTTAYNIGPCLSADQANFNGYDPLPGCPDGVNRGEPIEVASFAPNAWGLYEMHGNIEEWCWDWHAPYPTATTTDPRGPERGMFRVHRGGCWANFGANCRSADRESEPPTRRSDMIGLRVARSVLPAEAR